MQAEHLCAAHGIQTIAVSPVTCGQEELHDTLIKRTEHRLMKGRKIRQTIGTARRQVPEITVDPALDGAELVGTLLVVERHHPVCSAPSLSSFFKKSTLSERSPLHFMKMVLPGEHGGHSGLPARQAGCRASLIEKIMRRRDLRRSRVRSPAPRSRSGRGYPGR